MSDDKAFGTITTKDQAEVKAARLRMLHDNVLVWLPEMAEKTEGGVVIPDSAKEREREGTVIATGPGVPTSLEFYRAADDKSPPQVLGCSRGDIVIFPPSGASWIWKSAPHIVVVPFDDLIAILQPAPAGEVQIDEVPE